MGRVVRYGRIKRVSISFGASRRDRADDFRGSSRARHSRQRRPRQRSRSRWRGSPASGTSSSMTPASGCCARRAGRVSTASTRLTGHDTDRALAGSTVAGRLPRTSASSLLRRRAAREPPRLPAPLPLRVVVLLDPHPAQDADVAGPGRPRRAPNRAPARPASASPTAASIRASPRLRRAYREVKCGICSTNVRFEQLTCSQKNRRTPSSITTGAPLIGASATRRR
jgi:hypothetical protein